MDRYLVISSDGHAGPRSECYRDYLDPQYREEFDRQHAARMAMLEQAATSLEMRQESQKWAEGKDYGLSGAWDSDRRNEVIDADGVAAEILALMDQRYGDHHFSAKLGTGYKSHLTMKPSEYFRRNIRIGSSCMSRREAELRHEIGIDTVMWGTDYPHPEGTWPITKKMMIETFHGLPEDEIAKMLGGNVAEFYGFEVEALAPLVARIGPEKSWFRDEIQGENR